MSVAGLLEGERDLEAAAVALLERRGGAVEQPLEALLVLGGDGEVEPADARRSPAPEAAASTRCSSNGVRAPSGVAVEGEQPLGSSA